MRAKLSKGLLTVLVAGLLLAAILMVAATEPIPDKLAADVQALKEKAGEDGRIEVVIRLTGVQVPTLNVVPQERRLEELNRHLAGSQVLTFLNRKDVVVLNAFWIANIVLAEVPVNLLHTLASLPEVERLSENFVITILEPPCEGSLPGVVRTNSTCEGLNRIRV